MTPSFVAVDLETTGGSPHEHEIIEIGAVAFLPDRSAWFQSFVRPSGPIPASITRLTGITDDDVAWAPGVEEALRQFAAFASDLPLVAHNAPFDRAFLEAGGFQTHSPFVDSLFMARLLEPVETRHGLGALAKRHGLSLNHHRALDDARATAVLFAAFLAQLASLPEGLLSELRQLVAAPGDDDLAFLAGLLGPPGPSAVWAPGAPPVAPRPGQRPAALDEAFGAFLGRLGLEVRQGQQAMAKAVFRTQTEGDILLVEAGCGVGKSIGYLWPSLKGLKGQRVVISTHTHNLQEQLMEKDLPQVGDGFVPPPQAVLLKGRSNYVCLVRLEEARHRALQDGSSQRRKDLARVAAWLDVDDSGERGRSPVGIDLWADIQVLPDSCHREKCPHYDDCYFYAARRRAEQAEVLVVNHALLVSDADLGGGVIPPYDHLVVDEAHQLERVAREHLGLTFEDRQVQRGLERVTRTFQRRGAEVVRLAREAMFDLEAFSHALDDFLGEAQTVSLSGAAGVPLPEACTLAADRLVFRLTSLRSALRRLEGLFSPESAVALEYRSAMDLVTGAQATVEEALSGEADIRWVERRGKNALALRVSPLYVGAQLKEMLFDKTRSAVLTSATLAVEEDFSHILGLIGLGEDARVHTEVAPSPFFYRDQALLAAPTDLPDPREAEFGPKAMALLADLLPNAGGGTLVLFTSYLQLRAFYAGLKEELQSQGVTLLAQGIDGSRTSLLASLRAGGRVIVFGTQSFWEGIDVRGPALTLVVVVKLPFAPPDHPVLQARAERLAAEGGSPFMSLALPEAVLRFKQGFGRLIRSTEDSGVVLVLDRRLVTKGYGRSFVGSLDGPSTAFGPADEVMPKVRAWLSSARV